MNNYQQEALRTVSGRKFNTDVVPMSLMKWVVEKRLYFSKNLDNLKKALFYGKALSDENEICLHRAAQHSHIESEYMVEEDLVHGIIGADTENSELLELLLDGLKTGQIDRNKIIDECGDLLWYLNLTLTAVGSDIPEAQQKNIAKLRVRYPDKFTSYRAQNPNRQAEAAAQQSILAS